MVYCFVLIAQEKTGELNERIGDELSRGGCTSHSSRDIYLVGQTITTGPILGTLTTRNELGTFYLTQRKIPTNVMSEAEIPITRLKVRSTDEAT